MSPARAADADDAGRVGLKTLGWQLLLMMLVGLCSNAAWGWTSPGVAAVTDDAGGPLQPQLVSLSRASDAADAGRAARGAGVAAVVYDACGPFQPQLVSPARAVDADDAGRVVLENPDAGGPLQPQLASPADDAGIVGLEKTWVGCDAGGPQLVSPARGI